MQNKQKIINHLLRYLEIHITLLGDVTKQYGGHSYSRLRDIWE